MSTISGVSGSGDPFAQMRSQMQAKMFKKADSNGDGGVDKSEFTSMVNEVSKKTGKSFSSSAVDQAFAKLDSGGDSKISTDEMSKAVQSMRPPPPSTMDFARSMGSQSSPDSSTVNVGRNQGGRGNPMDGLFAKADADSSGSLDSSELKTLAAQIKSDTGDDVSAKLDKLASDNGGTVTKDQLKAAVEADQASGAGRPPPPPPPGGAGGPGGGGGPGGVGGTQSSSGSNTTYDKLDTNQDGTVSEVERLMGELQNAATDSSSSNSSSSQSASKKSSGFDAGQLIQQMYMQFSSGYSGRQSTFSAVA